jgi:two-component system CheB/CheR fusion protein
MNSSRKPLRVLVVDDNVGLAENIAEVLELEGHAAVIATSAEEAFEKTGPPPPDILVTDYKLPGMTGAMLVRQLAAAGHRVHSIVISAYTDEPTIEDARRSGASFVAKPIDLQVLGRLIGELEGSA